MGNSRNTIKTFVSNSSRDDTVSDIQPDFLNRRVALLQKYEQLQKNVCFTCFENLNIRMQRKITVTAKRIDYYREYLLQFKYLIVSDDI